MSRKVWLGYRQAAAAPSAAGPRRRKQEQSWEAASGCPQWNEVLAADQ